MICAMVLAAGGSRRMGAPKLLLLLAGKPVVAYVVDELLRSPVERVLVVVGGNEASLREALGSRKVAFIANPAPEDGMLSSVRCGLRAVPEGCSAVLVALGDQPGITAEVVRELVESFRVTPKGIVLPTCQGKRGHPILIAMRFRDEILNQFDGVGLRGILETHPDDVLEVEVDAPAINEDMDTPEDYQRLAVRFERGTK